MAMQTPQDLFLFELSSAYSGARLAAEATRQCAQEITDPQVRGALEEYERMLRQQMQNLDQCFQALGAQPMQVECKMVQGLIEEHNFVMQQNPPEEIHALYDLGADYKLTHFNKACYRGLAEKARLLGQQQVAERLEQNMQLEEQAAQRMEPVGRQFGQGTRRLTPNVFRTTGCVCLIDDMCDGAEEPSAPVYAQFGCAPNAVPCGALQGADAASGPRRDCLTPL